MKKFWKWKNQNPKPSEDGELVSERVLELYGTIAEESWFDDDITPRMFKDELMSGDGPITIWINSPGGDCIAASQIYAMLMDYKGEVTVKIDGLAASAASVIAMAGTKILMAPTAMMMIHNPITMAFGDHGDMEKAIDMLAEVKEAIINAYEIKTGQSRAKLSHMMDEETWMNANKAIELGFVDDILTDEKNSTEIPAYAFSGMRVANLLVNKLTAKVKAKEKSTDTDSKDESKNGRSVDVLMDRLILIKNQIGG
ncbi:MAG: Clp protease ClpP [Clostridia bacterium]|nr:Clp protease ClpP [Clostridia bacterium]